MFEITFLLMSLAVILILLDMSTSLKSMNKFLNIMSNYYSFEERNEEELDKSSYEIEKEKREKAFDERINQLLKEINSATPTNNTLSAGNTADILAEGIYNIPHGQVNINTPTPATEFAD